MFCMGDLEVTNLHIATVVFQLGAENPNYVWLNKSKCVKGKNSFKGKKI